MAHLTSTKRNLLTLNEDAVYMTDFYQKPRDNYV